MVCGDVGHHLSRLSSGVVYEYLSAVLSDVLHCQREPLPLCLALLQYDKELVSSDPPASPHPSVTHLHQYYSKWLPQQCREDLVSFWWNRGKGNTLVISLCMKITILFFSPAVQVLCMPFRGIVNTHFIHSTDESRVQPRAKRFA